MRPLVLNAWSRMNRDESILCLESTAPPTGVQVSEARQLAGGDHSVEISLSGLGLAMAPDDILVADGLIRRIAVGAPPLLAGASPLGVTLQVILEHAVRPAWTVIPGMPVLSEFSFPREPLQAVLAGRTIAIDPGHGGKDAGVRGPVDLLEKDVALAIALHLRDILAQSGTSVLMSREDDCDVDPRTWAMALAATTPDLLVEIHVSGVRDPMARTYRIYARTGSEASFKAAKEIAGGLTERMGITFGSIDWSDFPAIPLWPAVRVEPVCLSHFVDEANFRAPLFRKRIAQSIFNGIARYMSSGAEGGSARVG